MMKEDVAGFRELIDNTQLTSQQKDELQTILARAQYSYEDGKVLNMQNDAYIREVTADLFVRKDYLVVFLPVEAEVIREGAFEGFINLVSIVVGNKLEHIGERAFIDCDKLASIVLPNSCTYTESSFTEDCSIVNNTSKCQ